MYGNKIGEMVWMDLSVTHAEQVKDFYQKLLGWKSQTVAMSDNGQKYNDFAMSSAKNAGEQVSEDNKESNEEQGFVTGVCHAKGVNADMPAAWLPYFLVADIDLAVATVQSAGGSLVTAIKSMGDNKYIVIKDPAGAAFVLYQ